VWEAVKGDQGEGFEKALFPLSPLALLTSFRVTEDSRHRKRLDFRVERDPEDSRHKKRLGFRVE